MIQSVKNNRAQESMMMANVKNMTSLNNKSQESIDNKSYRSLRSQNTYKSDFKYRSALSQ